jgi:hypothetical protein
MSAQAIVDIDVLAVDNFAVTIGMIWLIRSQDKETIDQLSRADANMNYSIISA